MWTKASSNGPNLLTMSVTALVQDMSDEAVSDTDELMQWLQCQAMFVFSFIAAMPVLLTFAHFAWKESEQTLHLTNSVDDKCPQATAWHTVVGILVRTTTGLDICVRYMFVVCTLMAAMVAM